MKKKKLKAKYESLLAEYKLQGAMFNKALRDNSRLAARIVRCRRIIKRLGGALHSLHHASVFAVGEKPTVKLGNIVKEILMAEILKDREGYARRFWGVEP